MGGGGGGDTIPLARLDNPVTLPDNGIEAVASGQEPESGTLRVLNYADYINPETQAAFEAEMGTTLEITVYDTEDKLLSNLRNNSLTFDLVMGATTLQLPKFVVGELIQPLNQEYLPNFSNVLATLQSPYYDVGSKYTAPYVVYTTGIAYRRDKIDDAAFAGDDGVEVAVGPRQQGLRRSPGRRARGAHARHVLPGRHGHQHRRPRDPRRRRGRHQGAGGGHGRPLRHPRLAADPGGFVAHPPGVVG